MIALASDHGGYELKMAITEHLRERSLPYLDLGCEDKKSCDYPDFAELAGVALRRGVCDMAIIACTTGIGISIAANRIPGVRCALCTNPHMAQMTRSHNDANVLALGGATTGIELAMAIVDAFLDTPFSEEEKHIRRIQKLEELGMRK